jgi:uncharacterized protein (TIGR02300 family)
MSELGSKHECPNCASKFYDLGRSEIVCPKCGADQKELAQEADAAGKSAKKRPTVVAGAAKKAKKDDEKK